VAYIEDLYMNTVILTDIVFFFKRLHFLFKTSLHDSAEWLSQVFINIREVAVLNINYSSLLFQQLNMSFYSP